MNKEFEKEAYMQFPRKPGASVELPTGVTENMYAYRQMKKRRIFISGGNAMKEIAIRQAVATYGISGVGWTAEDFEKTLREFLK